MIDVLLASHRPDATQLSAQVDSIRRQKGVDVNLVVREDSAGEGPAANFSHLLSQSTAPYVAFSDQDDVWHEDKLSRLMECMVGIEEECGRDAPAMVFCDSVVTDAALRPLPGTFLSRQRVDVVRGLTLPRLLLQNFIAGNLMLFNAALREKAGEVPSAALMHDSWLAIVAAAFGRIGFVDAPLLDYRQHGANALGATAADAAHCGRRAREGVPAFRARLAANVAQAVAFVDRFGGASPECVRALADFPRVGYLGRRAAIFRHGLFKQGLLRNLALVLFA